MQTYERSDPYPELVRSIRVRHLQAPSPSLCRVSPILRRSVRSLLDLLKDLVALSGDVGSQGIDLLVLGSRSLLGCGDAGIEDSLLWVVAIGAMCNQCPTSSVGSTPRA